MRLYHFHFKDEETEAPRVKLCIAFWGLGSTFSTLGGGVAVKGRAPEESQVAAKPLHSRAWPSQGLEEG